MHLGGLDAHAELAVDVGLEVGQVPGAGVRLGRAAQVQERDQDPAHDVEDLLALIGLLEQLAAPAVDGLALLVHHVVVLEQVLSSGEVLRFDGLLRGRDALGDQLRLDRHVLFHAQPQHEVLDAIAAEDAEQVVLQREVEARTAGIALASGTAAQLVVDAARLVPFGAHDVQAAGARSPRRARRRSPS